MAICGFRADNFDFGCLEGSGLNRIVSFLERVESGASIEETGSGGESVLESLKAAGFVSRRGEEVFLEARGRAFLKTCKSFLTESSP